MSKLNLYVVAFILGEFEEREGNIIRFKHRQFVQKVLAENEEEAIKLTIKNTIAELNQRDRQDLIKPLLEYNPAQFTCCPWNDLPTAFKNLPNSDDDGLLSASEIAKVLNVSRQAIYIWQREGKIPFCYRNGNLAFDENAVKEACKKLKLGDKDNIKL